MKREKTRKWDLLLIGGCLLLAAGLLLFSRLGSAPGTEVVVRVDGAETARYSLWENGTYPLNGGTNVLVIENGEAWLSEADCPDHLCVKQGKISQSGQVITCLPNRLTVTVCGGQADVDAVS